jgi:hypothetical protein
VRCDKRDWLLLLHDVAYDHAVLQQAIKRHEDSKGTDEQVSSISGMTDLAAVKRAYTRRDRQATCMATHGFNLHLYAGLVMARRIKVARERAVEKSTVKIWAEMADDLAKRKEIEHSAIAILKRQSTHAVKHMFSARVTGHVAANAGSRGEQAAGGAEARKAIHLDEKTRLVRKKRQLEQDLEKVVESLRVIEERNERDEEAERERTGKDDGAGCASNTTGAPPVRSRPMEPIPKRPRR